MTIYATPFTPIDKKCTGPSTDAGFDSLDAVVAMMGEPQHRYKKMVIYEGVVFSNFVFHVDEAVSKG